MPQPGTHNCITDVGSIAVGHASSARHQTGVTVIRCDQQLTAACDIRGGAPGSRETAMLAEENLVQQIDALVLTGGSVFGLAAADGVTAALAAAGRGLRLGDESPLVPIVPAAVLYDLENSGDKNWGQTPPYRELGIEALETASTPATFGAVGAATGARAGTLQGGVGTASIDLGKGVVVGAIAAVNSIGSAVLPDGKTFYGWPYELNGEFGGQTAPKNSDLSEPLPKFSRLHSTAEAKAGKSTTLAVVATSMEFTRVELKRIATMAHDGMARAIRPAHSPFDGDIVFALSAAGVSGPRESASRSLAVTRAGAAAADCLTRSVCRGVYAAIGKFEN